MKKHSRHHFSKWSRLTSPIVRQINSVCLLMWLTGKNTASFLWYFCQEYISLIMRKYQTNFNMRNTLQNNCPVFFKNVSFMKYKESLRTFILKESRKIQLNVMHGPKPSLYLTLLGQGLNKGCRINNTVETALIS